MYINFSYNKKMQIQKENEHCAQNQIWGKWNFAFHAIALLRKTKLIPTTDPIQKAKTMAEKPKDKPKNHPRPRTSFASPNPIHLPLDNNQNK